MNLIWKMVLIACHCNRCKDMTFFRCFFFFISATFYVDRDIKMGHFVFRTISEKEKKIGTVFIFNTVGNIFLSCAVY